MSGKEKEFSIAAVSRELRGEICEVARAGDHGFSHPDALSTSDKRLTVRSVFAYIEGISHLLKVNALSGTKRSELSVGERLLAEGQTYELGDDGTVKNRPAKLRTISNIKFAFKVYAKSHGSGFVLDVTARGWQSLQRSLKVRDRLTHPKAFSDLSVFR